MAPLAILFLEDWKIQIPVGSLIDGWIERRYRIFGQGHAYRPQEKGNKGCNRQRSQRKNFQHIGLSLTAQQGASSMSMEFTRIGIIHRHFCLMGKEDKMRMPFSSPSSVPAVRLLIALAAFWLVAFSLAQTAPPYDAISIASPHEDETVFDNEGIVPVQILITPVAALRSGERITLYLDGNIVEGADVGVFVLRDIEGGQHDLQAMIVDADGAVVRSSAKVRFRVWRSGQSESPGMT